MPRRYLTPRQRAMRALPLPIGGLIGMAAGLLSGNRPAAVLGLVTLLAGLVAFFVAGLERR